MQKFSHPLIPTLLAACAGLLAGAAHADSTVTLYGLIDVNVSRYTAGSKSGAADDTMVNDGVVNGLNGSRWGIKTVEDLGDGLKANVVAEAGLSADTGALGQGGLAFGRQVYVGLSHARFGEVRLGRQYILEDGVMWQATPFGNALTLNPGTAVTNAGKSLPFWLNAPRANNILQYRTPDFSGFSATVQVAPSEGSTDRFHGVGAAYQSGPVYLGGSYEWNKPRNGGDNSNRSLTVAASYNFGVAKLMGGLQQNRNMTTTAGNGAFTGSNLTVTTDTSFVTKDMDGYTVGVEAPFASVWTLGANFSQMKYKAAGGAEASLGKAGVGLRYALSKLTFLYASASTATGDLKDYIAQEQVYQIGLRKAF